MAHSAPTTVRPLVALALSAALALAAGCVETVGLSASSPEAAGVTGRWTGSWRSGAISGNFALDIARASDRLMATAVWHGSPTIRREFSGTFADGRLILGDPKTEGLILTAQTRAVGGLSLGKGFDLLGPYALLVDGRPLTGTIDVSKAE